MATDTSLQDAIMQFPIVAWLQKHTQVYDSGGGVVYADCPICRGKKKLGVYRYNRVATCGRCREGGHGMGAWRGSAGLPRFVKLLEGCAWRDAFKIIYELAGLPEPPPPERGWGVDSIPKGAIKLSDCRSDERAVVLLQNRGVGHLIDSAYLCVDGKYSERIILPAYYRSTYLGFEAKATHPSQEFKSIYAPNMATDTALYTIRGWEEDASTEVAITESILDAETFYGLMNAVGCFGGFKPGQVSALIDLGVETLYWYLDGDAWHKIPKHLPYTTAFFRNMVVPMPADQDPNSLGFAGVESLKHQAREVATELDFMALSMEWRGSL